MATLGPDNPKVENDLRDALRRARAALLLSRSDDGAWAGDLSSSALSTATAVVALALVDRNRRVEEGRPSSAVPFGHKEQGDTIGAGLRWLAEHQNLDGGWGDTVRSLSNISTTTLCWAAFGMKEGAEDRYRATVEKAEQWLTRVAGGISPDEIGPAILARYGRDRTFSVPILTHCALAGRLGSGPMAWRHVIPLPFELAAFPPSFFAALRLPVVSYALPALIAIGQARHFHAPSRNPVIRWIRAAVRRGTLRVLEGLQPPNGGFLEATPLTSFVTMSLAGSGEWNHPVVRRGEEFLRRAQRADGSWPIDTNLTTWVTTLSVNALASGADGGGHGSEVSPADALRIRQWLLAQQYREVHPYTQAAPGGWAWTNLPGGVPDADDTAGALIALRNLGEPDEATRAAARAGLRWLLDLQNRDGGIPTFCRGWGTLPFDRSSADITAHAIRAWLAWRSLVSTELDGRIGGALRTALLFLLKAQRHDGSWLPLWFGNQHQVDDGNPTYGTARVVGALHAVLCPRTNAAQAADGRAILTAEERAVQWLIRRQQADGSWGGGEGGPASVEESGLATEALAMVASRGELANAIENKYGEQARDAARAGARWLAERVANGQWREASPIGFYFAKLWYFEKLYPQIFTVAALRSVVEAG